MDFKVEHIGIAVKDLKASISLYEQLLGSPCYKTESVASEQVDTAFFLQDHTKIELVASTDPQGVIAKFIEKNIVVAKTAMCAFMLFFNCYY